MAWCIPGVIPGSIEAKAYVRFYERDEQVYPGNDPGPH